MEIQSWIPLVPLGPGGGGRDSAYERGGDACRNFWIRPLKETDLGLAQAFFDPLSETTSTPTAFICGVPPGPGRQRLLLRGFRFLSSP